MPCYPLSLPSCPTYKLHHRLPVALTLSRVMALPDCSLPVAWTAFPPQAPCLAHTTDAAPCDLVQQTEMRGEVTKTTEKLKDYFLKLTKFSQQKTDRCIQ